MFDGVPALARRPGSHILTGPIANEGAEPGDTLDVRINRIELAIPYSYNTFGIGLLTDDFPYSHMRIIPLDRQRMTAQFALGNEVPLHPFFGSMGVTPPPGPRCSCPSTRRAHCFRWAMDMPRKATAILPSRC